MQMEKIHIFHSRLWRKIILVCLLIGTLPSLVIGVFSYHQAVSVVESKVNQSNIGRLGQVRLAVEMQLSAAENAMLQLIDSQIVLDNVDTELSGANFEKFNELTTTINSLPDLGLTTGSINLINLRKKWVVDNSGVYGLSDYESDNGAVEPFTQNQKYSFWVDALSMKKIGISTSQPVCVTLVMRYVGVADDCLATLNISYDSFGSLISRSGNFSSLYVISNDGCVLYNDNSKDLGRDLSASPMVKYIKKQHNDEGSVRMTVGGVPSVINYVQSNSYQWR